VLFLTKEKKDDLKHNRENFTSKMNVYNVSMKNFSKHYCNVLNHVLILVNLLEKVLMGI